MTQYYVIRLSNEKWLSAILNIGLSPSATRNDALRIKDLNVALSLLKLTADYPDAYVEEVVVTVTGIKE
jgi:hypothetical protein